MNYCYEKGVQKCILCIERLSLSWRVLYRNITLCMLKSEREAGKGLAVGVVTVGVAGVGVATSSICGLERRSEEFSGRRG